MSAVMSTLSMISGGRRAHRKLTSSRKSGQYSDVGEDRSCSHHDLNRQQRSSSMGSFVAANPGDGWGRRPRESGSQGLREESPATLAPEERAALEQRAAAVRAELDTRRAHILDLRRRLDQTHVTDLEEFHRAASCAAPARLALLRAAPPVTPPITHNEAVLLRTELEKLKTAAVEAEKTKEGLRTDNTRLTHRISYLEEQVSELLARHTQVHSSNSSDSCITVNKTKKNVTNINITSEPLNTSKQSPKSEVQVFQKGPDITAIVAKLPGLDGPEANLPVMRPRSNGSGASSRTSPAPQHRAHSSHSLDHRAGRGRHSLPQHCGAAADYSAETDAAIRMIERNQRHMEKQRLRTEKQRSKVDDRFRSDSDLDRKSWSSCDPRPTNQKASERIEESIKKTNWAERKTLSIIEQLKRSQRLRKLKKNESSEDIQVESDRQYVHNRIDGKVIENAHKSRRSSKLYSRSAKSSEFESECSDYPNGDIYSSSPRLDYGSESCSRLSHYKKSDETDEGKYRPTPPRKPLRLSLHKAKSAHSLMNGSESETPSRPPSGQGVQESSGKRPGKRSHGADRWARECSREGVRATPRPGRRTAPTLTTCEAPAADRLYPDTLPPARSSGSLSKWC
ncbi:unnamed protein product [Leptidea sinapis]|uniref:Uncharacterized protein n=1 Tax=Leptidea sinapis TaxID=189913 RepID=A0A5E4QK57_9NEOP|nr:unnamed protein product [Leptidea sinapis]